MSHLFLSASIETTSNTTAQGCCFNFPREPKATVIQAKWNLQYQGNFRTLYWSTAATEAVGRRRATRRPFEVGLNVMEVAAIIGHKTLDMLKRYTHLRAEELAKNLR